MSELVDNNKRLDPEAMEHRQWGPHHCHDYGESSGCCIDVGLGLLVSGFRNKVREDIAIFPPIS